jgi:hypothetical protein
VKDGNLRAEKVAENVLEITEHYENRNNNYISKKEKQQT